MNAVTAGSDAAAVAVAPSPAARLRPWRQHLGALLSFPRITGLDTARGLAVIGMIGAHVGVTAEFEWGQAATWTDLVHGRSSLLFALIAGVSIALMTGREVPVSGEALRAARLGLLGRAAMIFLIGLLLEALNTGVVVILTAYAVFFIAMIPFLGLRRRLLFLIAAAFALLGPALLALVNVLGMQPYSAGMQLVVLGTYPVTAWMALMLTGLALGRSDLSSLRVQLSALVAGLVLLGAGYGSEALLQPTAQALYERMDQYWEEDYGSGFDDSFEAELLPGEEVDLSGLECEVYSDATLYCGPPEMFSGFASAESANVESASLGESSWGEDMGSGSWEDEQISYWEQVWMQSPLETVAVSALDAEPHSGGTLEIVGSTGFALTVLSLCLFISRLPLARWVMMPLAALGSMPLTVYSAHIVVIALWSVLSEPPVNNMMWVLLAGGLTVGATAWAALLGRGPLERLTAWTARRTAYPQ